MRIWSIQSLRAWAHLQRHGTLNARREHRSDLAPRAYDWMREQLVRRIGPAGDPGWEPLWGWYKFEGSAKCPDLAWLRRWWGPSGDYVLIEFDLPESKVLLSDYYAWHIPLNDGYLGAGDHETDLFDSSLARSGWKAGDPVPEPFCSEMMSSWERIFDLEFLDTDDWGRMEDKSIQACFWSIELDDVRSYQPFKSVALSDFPK